MKGEKRKGVKVLVCGFEPEDAHSVNTLFLFQIFNQPANGHNSDKRTGHTDLSGQVTAKKWNQVF